VTPSRDAGAAGALDEVRGDGEVLIDEIGGVGGVRVDTADLCRGNDDGVRLVIREKREDLGLRGEIEFRAGGGEGFEAEGFGLADEGGANHAAVA
jgi:hypothetical protein